MYIHVYVHVCINIHVQGITHIVEGLYTRMVINFIISMYMYMYSCLNISVCTVCVCVHEHVCAQWACLNILHSSVSGRMSVPPSPPPQTGLHSWLWWCRYLWGVGAATLYVWEWYRFQDYGEKNYRLLEEIREMVGTMRTVGTARGKGGPEKMVREEGGEGR